MPHTVRSLDMFHDPMFHIRELNAPWRQVAHLGTRQKVPKGYLWVDSPDNTTFSFLDRGEVRLLSLSEGGKERIVLYVHAGCLFREIVFMHDSPLHPASLTAQEPCEVINFPRALLDDPAFGREYPALMSNLVHSLGAKAGAFFSQITERVEVPPQTQVCRYLHWLAESRREGAAGCSQSELALVLGLHRSTVCRIVSDLRDMGILGAFTRNTLEILDAEALARLCLHQSSGSS